MGSFVGTTADATGTVLVFMNPGWSLGNLTTEGDIASSSWVQATSTAGSGSTSLAVGGILDQFTLYIKYGLQKLGLAISNGIATVQQLFAQKVTTNELCVGTTCVNQQQLAQLLAQLNNSSTNGSSGGSSGTSPSVPVALGWRRISRPVVPLVSRSRHRRRMTLFRVPRNST